MGGLAMTQSLPIEPAGRARARTQSDVRARTPWQPLRGIHIEGFEADSRQALDAPGSDGYEATAQESRQAEALHLSERAASPGARRGGSEEMGVTAPSAWRGDGGVGGLQEELFCSV